MTFSPDPKYSWELTPLSLTLARCEFSASLIWPQVTVSLLNLCLFCFWLDGHLFEGKDQASQFVFRG